MAMKATVMEAHKLEYRIVRARMTVLSGSSWVGVVRSPQFDGVRLCMLAMNTDVITDARPAFKKFRETSGQI